MFWKCINEFKILECTEIVKDLDIAQLYGPEGRKNKILVIFCGSKNTKMILMIPIFDNISPEILFHLIISFFTYSLFPTSLCLFVVFPSHANFKSSVVVLIGLEIISVEFYKYAIPCPHENILRIFILLCKISQKSLF